MVKKNTAAADGGNETGAAGLTAETSPEITETGAGTRFEAEAEAERIIEQAKAAAEAIVSAARKKAEKSAEAESKPPSVPDGEELVDYTAPLLLGMTNQDIFVAVNGESIRIKRGERVKIKRKFLEALQNARAQEVEAYKYIEGAKRAGEKATAAM